MESSDQNNGLEDPVESSCHSIIPECPNDFKPYVGRKFNTLEEGIKFYESYAASCGFDTRLGTVTKAKDGTILSKYVLCNREGVKNTDSDVLRTSFDSKQIKKRRLSTRTDCRARVILNFCANEGYVVKFLDEEHNHSLVSEEYRHFMKYNRKIGCVHQSFIIGCARANIGPMKSFRLFKELVGGYDKIGCNIIDFKNFSRDLRAHVIGVDAQIMLNKLKNKRDLCPGFIFDYCVDEDDKLKCLFWADALAIKKFHYFGDAVSFDATYSTNKYQMIFAPFTGKDSNGRCVTFAAGLLTNENVESYSWLFKKFLDCMGTQPKLLITDQDPAMKIAVERIFPETMHRFCMWHIMLKVADKIPKSLREDEVFAKRLNEIVWSENLEPIEFDHHWDVVLSEYCLTDDTWFKSMFQLRKHWIPAYFRDCPLSGLFRTTSISESENSFFRRYLNRQANLIEFFMNFDTAIDAQRNASAQLCSVDESSFPELKTQLMLEKHAASVYTHKIFYDVQEEILAAVNVCCLVNMTMESEVTIYEVDGVMSEKFKVVHDLSDDSITCGCKRFIRHGLLCCHVFFVLKNMKFKRIPDKYILPRWTKFACPQDVTKIMK